MYLCGPSSLGNGTLENTLTGMRTNTVTNGTIFFSFFLFLIEIKCVMDPSGDNTTVENTGSRFVTRCCPYEEAEDEKRLNASLPCSG